MFRGVVSLFGLKKCCMLFPIKSDKRCVNSVSVSLSWHCVSAPDPDGLSVQSVQGMLYNPASGAWSWTNSTAINYALHAIKARDDLQSEAAKEEVEQHSRGTISWAKEPCRVTETLRQQPSAPSLASWKWNGTCESSMASASELRNRGSHHFRCATLLIQLYIAAWNVIHEWEYNWEGGFSLGLPLWK